MNSRAKLLFLVAATWMAPSAWCQTVTGTITGNVTDPSSGVVASASVRAVNVQTGQEKTTKTDGAGRYEFPFVPVGDYRLVVEAPGFNKNEMPAFPLSVNQVARIDLTLTVGDVANVVTVQGAATNLQTEEASVSTVIDQRKVEDLPLNGRTFVDLALLTPGVNNATPGAITARRGRGSLGQGSGMSANGARDTQNRFFFDGIEAMDLDSYSFSFAPSIDAIEEFRVGTSSATAEVGGAPGGYVNVMTRNGGSRLHGSAWDYNRNDAFETLAPFQPATPTAKAPRLNRNQFGANLGGPVFVPKLYNGKEKTFFFFNWEAGRQVAGNFGPQAFVAPAAYRTGDFSSSAYTIVDPSTGTPFAGNIIPNARIRPYATAFLKLGMPLPTPGVNTPGVNYLGTPQSAPTDQDQYIARVDHRFSDRNSMYGSYMYNLQKTLSLGAFPGTDAGNSAKGQNLSIGDTHAFSSTIVNDFHVGWHRFYEHQFFGSTSNATYDYGKALGIAGITSNPRDFGPPTLNGIGYSAATVPNSGPRDRLNQLWQFSDTLVIRKGAHGLKMGATVYRRNWTFDEALFPRGVFTFDGSVTLLAGQKVDREQGFAAFLLGLATSAQVSVTPFATRLNNWNQAYFFQDDWKVTKNLTLNLGMRYEYFSPATQRGGGISNFAVNGAVPGYVPSQQLYAGFGNITNSPGYPNSLIYPDRKNFGPRFGFAYLLPRMPDFVIRGGYGIFYAPEISNSLTLLTFNPPITSSSIFTGSVAAPLQVETVFQSTPGQSKNNQFGSYAVDPNMKNAFTQEWNLTLQKRLPGELYLDLGYVGSQSSRLSEAFDGNRPIQVVVPGTPGLASVDARRPFQGFGTLQVTKSIGMSNYNSLQVRVQRRVAQGLSVIGAYTWAKNLSNADASTVGAGSGVIAVQDYLNSAADKSFTGFDVRHRLASAIVWDVPFLTHARNRLARGVVAGWQLSVITTIQTGPGFNLAQIGDTTGTGVSSRSSIVPGQVIELSRDQRSRDRWFNTAAVVTTPLGRFGTAPREAFHMPGRIDNDLSATKIFRITEGHSVQFRAEIFDLFNHADLNVPGNDLRTANTFGIITGGYNQRLAQFSLKYRF